MAEKRVFLTAGGMEKLEDELDMPWTLEISVRTRSMIRRKMNKLN